VIDHDTIFFGGADGNLSAIHSSGLRALNDQRGMLGGRGRR